MTFTATLDQIVSANVNGLLGARPGWNRTQLGGVASILNGFPFKSDNFTKGNGTPLLRIRDIVRGTTETCYDGVYDAAYLVQPGDLVVGMDGDFNCALWPGPPALLNQRVCKITTDETRYSRRFLLHVLPGYLAAINANTPSLTVKHLSSRTVADIPLPFPPLAEQVGIADELDKQFTRLDAGIAALKRVQTSLTRHRTAVLKAACEGSLVPTEAELARHEHRSYETASILAQGIAVKRARMDAPSWRRLRARPATGTLSPDLPALPEGWAWTTVAQLAAVLGGLTKSPKRAKLPHQLPYLRVANVYANELHLNEIEQIGVEDRELDKLLLAPGDLLIVEGNGSREQIGRVALWDGSIDPCVHQNHLIKVRLEEPRMAPWVLAWLLSPGGRDLIERVASSTSGLYTLSVGKVGNLVVPLPPMAEQARIVAELERRLSLADDLNQVVSGNIHRAMRLRQSILSRALGGELRLDRGHYRARAMGA